MSSGRLSNATCRWQQTYRVKPLFSELCACSELRKQCKFTQLVCCHLALESLPFEALAGSTQHFTKNADCHSELGPSSFFKGRLRGGKGAKTKGFGKKHLAYINICMVSGTMPYSCVILFLFPFYLFLLYFDRLLNITRQDDHIKVRASPN